MYYEWDWTGAEKSFRRALELNPNIAMNHYHYSWYLVLFHRWEEAIAEHKRARELDPLTPVHTAYLAGVYLYQGDDDRAMVEARKAVESFPTAPAAYMVLGRALQNKRQTVEAETMMRRAVQLNPVLTEFELGIMLAERGKSDEARAILAKLLAQPPTPWSVWSLSQLYIALGDHDSAFTWLSHRPAHAFLPWIRVNPAYKPIRADPRFIKLMNEMHLPPP